MVNYARIIAATLWDSEVVLSCNLSVPDGLNIRVVHGLEREPVIEWGHDASIHGHAGITVSMAVLHETRFWNNRQNQGACINNVALVAFLVRKPWVGCPISSTLPQTCLHNVISLAHKSNMFSQGLCDFRWFTRSGH